MISPFLALVAAVGMRTQPIVKQPIQITMQDSIGVERTIAEFMDVCFRPKWNVDDVRRALKGADPAYVERHIDEKNSERPSAFVWDSPHSHLALFSLAQFSQCALSIASDQPRTGNQLLAMLRPAVEAELGHSVQENDDKFYLEWTDPDSGYVERVTLGLATGQPSQSIWYVFDRTAPGVREKLESLTPAPKPPSK